MPVRPCSQYSSFPPPWPVSTDVRFDAPFDWQITSEALVQCQALPVLDQRRSRCPNTGHPLVTADICRKDHLGKNCGASQERHKIWQLAPPYVKLRQIGWGLRCRRGQAGARRGSAPLVYPVIHVWRRIQSDLQSLTFLGEGMFIHRIQCRNKMYDLNNISQLFFPLNTIHCCLFLLFESTCIRVWRCGRFLFYCPPLCHLVL